MLQGLRVTDMTSVIFGPYATQILADLGADVVKVESTAGGDAVRLIGKPPATPGMGPVHLRLNRGKRSVDWDLKTEDGRAAMHRLIASSDVFIHNVRADAIERAGLGYERVRTLRPDIVYVHCTGFDQAGPYAGLQAYDDIIQAASGIATLLPATDGNPRPRFLPMTLADKVSGLHGAYAVLAALVHRLRTGEGQFVEVPMFEAVTSFHLLEHLCDRSFVPPTGEALYARQIDRARQPMPTADGWIAIAPYLDDRWLRFFELAGRSELLQEPALADPLSRRRNMSRLYELMETITPTRTTADWLAALAAANIPAMRVNTVDGLFDDPQLQACGLLRQRSHPTEGEFVEVRPPVRFSAWDAPDAAPAARVGQHSEEVARELGVGLAPRA